MQEEAQRRRQRMGGAQGPARLENITVATLSDNERFVIESVPDATSTTPGTIVDQIVSEGLVPPLPAGQRYRLALLGGHVLDQDASLAAQGVESGATMQLITHGMGAAPPAVASGEVTGAIACPSTIGLSRPCWLTTLESYHRARAAHFFLLDLNVDDYVFDGIRPPQRVAQYLAADLRDRGYSRIALLSSSSGLGWANGSAPGVSARPSAEPSAMLWALAEALEQRADAQTAVIIENIDHLAPADGGDREAVKATEILVRLAQDEKLRAAGCLIIALCHAREGVASHLLDAAGGIVTIRIPLPDAASRLRFLSTRPAAVPGLRQDGLTRDIIANLAQGLRLADLDGLDRRERLDGEAITADRVREYKRETIERLSKGLLESIEPRHGFDSVGGLGHVLSYLKATVANIREGRTDYVPNGILLAGPPGTGKTLVAEALAKEAGFNLVRIGDVRSMWVGGSERNLSLVLRVLVELVPVVVFVDEADQMLGRRDQGAHLDSGVSARLFGRVLNFMDRHRGRVVWAAATNRPDLLDQAMLRRFDRVFPFFVPSAHERHRIFAAMPVITGAVYETGLCLDRVVDATHDLTGSAIEVIVRRAMELAGGAPLSEELLVRASEDYKPNHDPRVYRFQSLLALDAANFYSSLPAVDDMPEEIAELVGEMRRRCSAAPLHERMLRLRAASGAQA